MNDNYLVCPKCGSKKLQLYQKGFSIGKSIAGGVVAGPVGLLAGTFGSKKIKAICQCCGEIVTPISYKEKKEKDERLSSQGSDEDLTIGIIAFVVIAIAAVWFIVWLFF